MMSVNKSKQKAAAMSQIKVKKTSEKRSCLHCLETSNTLIINLKGSQFVLCEKCSKELIDELGKALKSIG